MKRVRLALLVSAFCACGDDPPTAPDTGGVDAGDTDVRDAGAGDASSDTPADTDSDDTPAADATDTEDDPADGADADDAGPIEFLSTPDAIVQAGIEWNYTIELTGSAETTLSVGPEGATLQSGALTWIPPTMGVSNADFAIDASRRNETIATQSFSVEVNHPPAFFDVPPANAFVGREWEHAPTVTDEDSDLIVWRLDSGPDWLSISEDGRLLGTPMEAGAVSFAVGASDGRGGDAIQVSELTVVEPIRDLRTSTYWLKNRHADFSIFGCCFSAPGPEVFWGGQELTVTVVNAGRLDLAFDSPPPPGDQPVVLLVDDVAAGELPYPITILPDPVVESDTVSLTGVAGASIRLLNFDLEVLEVASSETDEWSSAPLNGIVIAEVDGVLSEPVWVSENGDAELISVSPRVHAAGSSVSFEFSAEAVEPIVARWGAESATCFPTTPRHCAASVPERAVGFVQVTSMGSPVASQTSAVAGSPGGLGAGPWIDWANRITLRSGTPTLVLISTLGGAPSSADADLELVELGESYALVRVRADGPSASIVVRGDIWHFEVD